MGNIRPALGLAALLAVATAAVAQSDFYPFAIDQDRLSGAPDFSFLNHPITPADRLFIRDSHFFRLGPDLTPNTGDDERVHLFGVNLAFGANFPAEQDAARIAARLSRLGVNLVRLHHMDSSPDAKPANAGSLLTTGPYPTLNAVAVTRLRRFIDALKAEGIYIDLNLHVGYQFRPAIDDVPAHETFPRQSKPLHVFWPRMIELQADFTRQVIEALELNDDPALGVVEINNESSLIDTWQRQSLDTIVTGDYRSELTRQWNTHLAAAYPNTEALREAWGASEADGPDLLGERWVIENHTRFPARLEPAAEREESPVVRVETTGGGAPIIVKQTGFSVAAGRAYTAEVELRAGLAPGAGRGIYWDVKQDANPWRTVAGRTVTVTAAWQKFRMSVQPSFSIENGGRFGLSIENVGAPVYIRNWKLYAAGRRGLGEDESLEAKSVPLVAQAELATGPRLNDYLLFLIGCDRAYLDGILAVVREATGPLVPVAGTQLSFGGLANLDSHESLDYQDHHFYIDHYNFPNRAWDGRDWRMRDTSAVGTGLQSLLNMAAGHQAGRPYTVSEYNQPWPNTHAAETDPVIAVFGRFQDWDSVMHFAYSHGRGWDDGVPNGFNINGDWTKFPNFGQSAWLFRSGAIQVGREPVEIPMPLEQRLRATRERRNGSIASFLNASLGYDPALALRHPVRLVKDSDAALPQAAREKLASPYRGDTGEFTYDAGAGRFLVHASQAAGVYGFVREKVTAGALDIELAPNARGFVALLVTSLDGEPLEKSSRMLVSNPGYTLRTQPGAEPPRPQQLVKYGSTADWWTLEPEPAYAGKPSGNLNGGLRPVWMERVEAFLTLRCEAAGLTVYPLDGSGQRLEPLPADSVQAVEGGYRIHLEADGQPWSPWYEIVTDK